MKSAVRDYTMRRHLIRYVLNGVSLFEIRLEVPTDGMPLELQEKANALMAGIGRPEWKLPVIPPSPQDVVRECCCAASRAVKSVDQDVLEQTWSQALAQPELPTPVIDEITKQIYAQLQDRGLNVRAFGVSVRLLAMSYDREYDIGDNTIVSARELARALKQEDAELRKLERKMRF